MTNYTPMHARELLGSVEVKVSKVRSVQFKTKEQKLQKKNQTDGLVEIEREMPYCDQNFKKILEEDTSNRSSSGSAISFTEHFGTTEASDFTGDQTHFFVLFRFIEILLFCTLMFGFVVSSGMPVEL